MNFEISGIPENPAEGWELVCLKDEHGVPFPKEDLPTFTPDTAPDVTCGTSEVSDGWQFVIAEEFRVKPVNGDTESDLWLVGRRGKPAFQVSLKEENGGKYHREGIPWKCILHEVGKEQSKVREIIERTKHEEEMRQFCADLEKRRQEEREAEVKPESLWRKLWNWVFKIVA